MTKPTITFAGKTYFSEHSGLVVKNPAQCQNLDDLGGPQLIELYNLVASNLGQGRVKRFADLTSARKRTWAKLVEWDAQADDDFQMSDEELAGQKGRVKADPEAPVVAEVGSGSKVVQDTSAPNSFKLQLSDADKAQVAAEAAARKPAPKSEQLLQMAAAAGAKTSAQSALRNSPPASDNPAKDAEMPALRKAAKALDLAPKAKVYARKAGSKQATLVDLLSRPQGATFGELYDALAVGGKPWKGVTIRSGLAWDINHIAGYGVKSEMLNGEQFAAAGRKYEAMRLGMLADSVAADGTILGWCPGEGYDPELRLAVYRLVYPAGMTEPLPHIGKKA